MLGDQLIEKRDDLSTRPRHVDRDDEIVRFVPVQRV